MTTNAYFEGLYTAVDKDQRLFESLIIEAIKIHGRDFYYIPRTLTNFDSFFGEDSQSAFNSAFKIELYLENLQQWGDQGHFLSKFEVELRDSAYLVVSQSRFNEVITSNMPNIVRPREGDILAFPSTLDNRMRFFEISYVNNEDVFYQLGKLYTYKLTIKNFEYNGEQFDTGITSFDNFNPDAFIPTMVVDPQQAPVVVPTDSDYIQTSKDILVDPTDNENPILS